MHQISANDIDGNPINFSKYDGNILLISNVASYCGLTKCSYKLFTELADKYYDKGLRILLIPCNQVFLLVEIFVVFIVALLCYVFCSLEIKSQTILKLSNPLLKPFLRNWKYLKK